MVCVDTHGREQENKNEVMEAREKPHEGRGDEGLETEMAMFFFTFLPIFQSPVRKSVISLCFAILFISLHHRLEQIKKYKLPVGSLSRDMSTRRKPSRS